MTDTYERCSCGDCPSGNPRDRTKCSKESLSGGGKMCVKELKAQSVFTDEQRLLNDPKYSKQWVEEETEKSVDWFIEEIYNGTH